MRLCVKDLSGSGTQHDPLSVSYVVIGGWFVIEIFMSIFFFYVKLLRKSVITILVYFRFIVYLCGVFFYHRRLLSEGFFQCDNTLLHQKNECDDIASLIFHLQT